MTGAQDAPAAHPLVLRLRQVASPDDVDRVTDLLASARRALVAPDHDIVADTDRPAVCRVLVHGFACRYKVLSDGSRQITAFVVPGDICDLHAFVSGRMDHAVGALEASSVALLPHEELRDAIERWPSLGLALWRLSVVETAVAREWVANVGRRDSYQRMAHLLCEVFTRLRAVGLAHGEDGFAWPLTQGEIGDAMGISNVHTNRVLRALREDGLIAVEGRTVVIKDQARLRQAGGFDPGYLMAHRPE